MTIQEKEKLFNKIKWKCYLRYYNWRTTDVDY